MGNNNNSSLNFISRTCCQTSTILNTDIFYKIGTYEQQTSKYFMKYPLIQKVLKNTNNNNKNNNKNNGKNNKNNNDILQCILSQYTINKSNIYKFNHGVYIGQVNNENKLPETIIGGGKKDEKGNESGNKNNKSKAIFLYQIPFNIQGSNNNNINNINNNNNNNTKPNQPITTNKLQQKSQQSPSLNNQKTQTNSQIIKYKSFYYQGQFKNGKRQGYGLMINDQGDYYIGQWINNLPMGKGEYIKYNNKMKYTGKFYNGLQHGYGVEEYQDGSRYQGEFNLGNKQGQGKYSIIYNNVETIYTGSFVHNQFHGKGISIGKYHKYQGDWYQGKMTGNGISTWYNDKDQILAVYIGQYKNGLKHGYGEYRWGNQKVYKGKWKDGDMINLGVLVNYGNQDQQKEKQKQKNNKMKIQQ